MMPFAQVSPWDEASQSDEGLKAKHLVKDLVGVMTFFDVLHDITIMNSLGRAEGPSRSSFLERIFGRRRPRSAHELLPAQGQTTAQTPLVHESTQREGDYIIFGPGRSAESDLSDIVV
jgi:hypothetical protein